MVERLKRDILGGVTAAVVALPLALAFGVTSGVGATAGLYGAIVLGFCASLFGGTPTQVSGPTGPMTVVVAAALVTFHGDVNSLMLAIFLAGIIQVLFGVIGIGKYVRYIPYPVISGFMSGIGCIIIILQINPFVGVGDLGSVLGTLKELPHTLATINPQAGVIAVLTLAIMFLTPAWVARFVPPPLIALITMTILSVQLHLSIPVIGTIPTELPTVYRPYFDINQMGVIVPVAFTLALLGMIDTLLTSLVADSLTKVKHNSNRELMGQGIGNALCSFIGGIPGAGATMRTVVNIKSGGQTRVSGMVHAVMLLTTVLFFAPLAEQIPLALLAGILMKVGLDILDYRFLRILRIAPKAELLVMAVVFGLTVFVDLIAAVGVGIVLASFLTLRRVVQAADIRLGADETSEHSRRIDEHTLLVTIDGPLFFGTTLLLEEKVSEILDTKTIIIDCEAVSFIDLSARFVVEETVVQFHEDKTAVVLVMREEHEQMIARLDTAGVFQGVTIYNSLTKALPAVPTQKADSLN